MPGHSPDERRNMEISNNNTEMTIDFYEYFRVVFKDKNEKMQFIEWIKSHGEIREDNSEDDDDEEEIYDDEDNGPDYFNQ